MSYDFKLYLLIGAIIFVAIQIAVFISSAYEQIISLISEAIKNFIERKSNLHGDQALNWFIKICFIPLTLSLIDKCEKWINAITIDKYSNFLIVMLLFIKIYVILSLIFQEKQYGSNMNTTNFILIIIALTFSLYIGRATFEEYLLTDAKLINNQNEKSIELLLIDNKAIYYKENDTYKYEILGKDTLIEFLNNGN